MNIKCDFCGSMIDERCTSCPHCGAPISGANRMAHQQPKTIEELKQWYVAHKLPPENITRFFIGKDIKEPKAFGIYKNATGDCVVYKNKSTGERAIRYQGADEAYAVNELYQRLKAEIADQKAASHAARPATAMDNVNKKKDRSTLKGCGCLTLVFAIILGGMFALTKIDPSPNGYYKYNGTEYYHQGFSWYRYDPATDDWLETESMKKIITDENASQYSFSGHEGKSFEETSWYDDGSSYHSDDDDDWDSDSRWDDDNDSWNSSSTDWDSDW